MPPLPHLIFEVNARLNSNFEVSQLKHCNKFKYCKLIIDGISCSNMKDLFQNVEYFIKDFCKFGCTNNNEGMYYHLISKINDSELYMTRV